MCQSTWLDRDCSYNVKLEHVSRSLKFYLYIKFFNGIITHSFTLSFLFYQLMSSTAEMKAAEKECSDVQGAAAAAAAAAEEPGGSGLQQTSTKPTWSLLEEAGQMKTEGNAFYREKNIRSAIGRYHRALLILRGLDSDVMARVKDFGPKTPALTPEQDTLLRNTQVDCYNNLAGRYNFRTCKVERALEYPTQGEILLFHIICLILFVVASHNQEVVSCSYWFCKEYFVSFLLCSSTAVYSLIFDLLVCTYLSFSACLLQRESVNFARVQEYSLRVLQWRPGNVKALYRAGVATLEMGDAVMAKQYLIQAGREQPNGKKRASTSESSTAGWCLKIKKYWNIIFFMNFAFWHHRDLF